MSAAPVLVKAAWPEDPLERSTPTSSLAKLRWLACASKLSSLARSLLILYLTFKCTSRAKQWRPSFVIVCKFSRFCPYHRLPVSEDSVKWIALIQRSEAVLQLLPNWVICWWLVSTAYVIGMSTSMFYCGWKLGDMALWTSLRANQVARTRWRKLLSYLLDSPKSWLHILLSTNFRCI